MAFFGNIQQGGEMSKTLHWSFTKFNLNKGEKKRIIASEKEKYSIWGMMVLL